MFNVPNLSLSLAGFQLITIGRFWVITEAVAVAMIVLALFAALNTKRDRERNNSE